MQVISFDVLEHIKAEDQEKFVSETTRVLKPNGILLIGCPNKKVSVGTNPYHLKELTKEELNQLLLNYYENVEILGQDILIDGIRQKQNWHKCLLNLSYQNLIIVREECDLAYGLLAMCKKPKS